jgi:hypothetical protein
MILADHNRVQMIGVSWHKGIAGNAAGKTENRYSFAWLKHACSISDGAVRDWRSRKNLEHWKSITGLRQGKFHVLGPPLSKTKDLLQKQNGNQLKSMTGLLTSCCHLKEHLYKLGLDGSLNCNRCVENYETALHMLCYCKAIAGLWYHNFRAHLKPSDYCKVPSYKLLQFIQDAGL